MARNRHKDYIFQKRLALRLPIDSFRFDFRYVFILHTFAPHQTVFYRGSHESGGTWRQTPILNDVEDIRVIVAYLASRYGYHVDLVIGHSRGANVGIYWCCMTEEGRKVSAFVNVSGRYRMEVRCFSVLLLYALFFSLLSVFGSFSLFCTDVIKPDL